MESTLAPWLKHIKLPQVVKESSGSDGQFKSPSYVLPRGASESVSTTRGNGLAGSSAGDAAMSALKLTSIESDATFAAGTLTVLKS